jgi:hypothetical protein
MSNTLNKPQQSLPLVAGTAKTLTIISVGLNFIPGCQGWCSMAFNAAMADANGGTIAQVLKGAAVGYVSGELSGLGTAVLGAAMGGTALANVAAGMTMGGVIAKAQGGKFIDGVKGAVVAMGISYGINRIANAADKKAEATMSVKGDVASEGNVAAFQEKLDALAADKTLNSYKTFDSPDAAATEFLGVTASLSAEYGLEVGGNIWKSDNGWRYTRPKIGGPGSVGEVMQGHPRGDAGTPTTEVQGHPQQ